MNDGRQMDLVKMLTVDKRGKSYEEAINEAERKTQEYGVSQAQHTIENIWIYESDKYIVITITLKKEAR